MSDPNAPGPSVTGPIRAIAAVAANGVIGADNDLIWTSREDFQRLKALTMGGALVMGRRTFDSIGRPLPGRTSHVVTRNQQWSADGVIVHHDVDAALDAALASGRPVWVFGGGAIYRAAWPRIVELEITAIAASFDGDTTFPEIDPQTWKETARDVRDGFSWVSYRRR